MAGVSTKSNAAARALEEEQAGAPAPHIFTGQKYLKDDHQGEAPSGSPSLS